MGEHRRAMAIRFYDAHNHLQDDRFGGRQAELLAACAQAGVARMVVNGACEEDWPQVLALAKAFPLTPSLSLSDGERVAEGRVRGTSILPSFGYHPWYLHERTPDWLPNLAKILDSVPAAVGEIGLDRWKPGLPYAGQEEAFIAQLRLAAQRNLPVSIHCLQAWGRMLEILQSEPRPARGFLLHSYGGPQEMVKAFADLGAYFSLPGYYAHERKERQRETFRHVPADRLLIETDAPDQNLPDNLNRFPLADSATGKALNHPANLAAVYHFAAELFGEPEETLAARVEGNFLRLFGEI
jgi:TatD DNase family protein